MGAWIVYNKRTGEIAASTNDDQEGAMLRRVRDLPDDFMWDVVYVKNFPLEIPEHLCRFVNGGLIILRPESIRLSIKGEDGEVVAAPGETVTIKAEFLNHFGKPRKVTGLLRWRHDRGFIRPAAAKVTGRYDAYATLVLPNENIPVRVSATLNKFDPGSIVIRIE